MPCFTPLRAWYSQELTASGKRRVQFDSIGAFGDSFSVPCGSCSGCRARRIDEWATRMVHESKSHEAASFITLTYDDDHLPPDGGLQPRDAALFMKRLRKDIAPLSDPPLRVRFFLVGEYGDQTKRAHYHAIIFGFDFADDRVELPGQAHSGKLYRSPRLERLWPFGHCSVGLVSVESCRYVAGYIQKRFTGELAKVMYQGREAPFARFSRNLGVDHFETFKSDYLPDGFAVVSGVRRGLPRSYERRVSDADIAPIKARRKAHALSRAADATPRRLDARAEVFAARSSLRRRTL